MALVTIDMMITSLADVAPMIAFLEHVASNSTTIRKYKKRVGTSSQRSPHCDILQFRTIENIENSNPNNQFTCEVQYVVHVVHVAAGSEGVHTIAASANEKPIGAHWAAKYASRGETAHII